MFKAILISLVVGGLATSFAEYHFKYNLVDLIVEKVKAFIAKVKGVFTKKAAN